ncbi:SDR family NAD(P)-dependent oxidoreductase [Tenuibacillus multivorans]|uniref:Nucleoside-diphosphate-sugar epimerase n=1 Tax=Tenuibacillus multivorans TaxID=237069 RepID=A0A1G9YJ91_9BACI|nr:SDR family NAD(P)-dependent oxidoreductase [Tenuibacillus multivorans]GEL78503.1 membrane protein [Tenuibacillus multivorans]SDN08576.1 Nucleoside-diphosphate-sugar epimerase [Tenuibacillus multivorans]
MKKALVLGASGGMGSAIVNELQSRGVKVVAFARTEEKLKKLFGERSEVSIVPGDVFQYEDLIQAAEGVDVIFHSVNIPYYEWAEKQETLMTNIVKASEQVGCKLAIVDNIYAYGKSQGEKVSEDSPKKPNTKKGVIRLKLENIVKSSNTPWLIVHFPDFYGPNAEDTVLGQTLQAAANNKSGIYIGRKQLKREFIFIPDGAKAIAELANRENAYGQNWNIPGYDVITGHEILEILKDEAGYNKRVMTVKRGMIRFLGIFDKMMKEFVEMMYLNEQPVILSGEKYEKHIGPLPKTSYRQGIMRTLESMNRL